MVAGLAGEASQGLAVDVSGVPPFTLPPHAPEAPAVWSGVWREAAWIACARDERANACGGRHGARMSSGALRVGTDYDGRLSVRLTLYLPVKVARRRLRACSIARHPITNMVPLTAPLASISGADTGGLGGVVVLQPTVTPPTTSPHVNVFGGLGGLGGPLPPVVPPEPVALFVLPTGGGGGGGGGVTWGGGGVTWGGGGVTW